MARREKMPFPERVILQLNDRFIKVVNAGFTKALDGSIVSCGSKQAINSFDNDREEVDATFWFEKYWFYMRIQFNINEKRQVKPFVSVSFFQDMGDSLKQLFRAEWDSYPVRDGYNHPQPHWHFTAQLSDKTSFGELQNAEEENIYSALAGNSQTINLDRVHFAMAGTWQDGGKMIAVVDDELTLVDWLINLFAHVRAELEYKERTKAE